MERTVHFSVDGAVERHEAFVAVVVAAAAVDDDEDDVAVDGINAD